MFSFLEKNRTSDMHLAEEGLFSLSLSLGKSSERDVLQLCSITLWTESGSFAQEETLEHTLNLFSFPFSFWHTVQSLFSLRILFGFLHVHEKSAVLRSEEVHMLLLQWIPFCIWLLLCMQLWQFLGSREKRRIYTIHVSLPSPFAAYSFWKIPNQKYQGCTGAKQTWQNWEREISYKNKN